MVSVQFEFGQNKYASKGNPVWVLMNHMLHRRKKEEQKRKKDQAKILGKHGARTKLSFKLG